MCLFQVWGLEVQPSGQKLCLRSNFLCSQPAPEQFWGWVFNHRIFLGFMASPCHIPRETFQNRWHNSFTDPLDFQSIFQMLNQHLTAEYFQCLLSFDTLYFSDTVFQSIVLHGILSTCSAKSIQTWSRKPDSRSFGWIFSCCSGKRIWKPRDWVSEICAFIHKTVSPQLHYLHNCLPSPLFICVIRLRYFF